MREDNKRSTTGTIIKIIVLALILIIASAFIYGRALLHGRAPVPMAVINFIAEKADIPPEDKEHLVKAVNVYTILQKSELSNEVKDLRKTALRGASENEIKERVHNIYTSLPDSTIEEIREEMEMTPDDFLAGKGIIDRAMESYSTTGEFHLSADEKQTLRIMGEKYGFTEEDLDNWTPASD